MSDLKSKAWAVLQKLGGWCDEGKCHTLIDLVLQYQPVTIVESGIFAGRSVIAMAMACQHTGIGKVYGIDPWEAMAALEGENGAENDKWWSALDLEQVYIGFMQNVIALRLTGELCWLRMKSERAAKIFDDRSVGLFHSDANHSELVSCREVETWHEKLTDNGLWVWDDTDWTSQHKALGMVRDKGFDVLIDHGNWMVFQRKAV